MLSEKELFGKTRIGEKAFKKFLRIKKYLDPEPIEGIEMKDCVLDLQYTFISILKATSVYDHGAHDVALNIVAPREQIECWIRVYYRTERDDYASRANPDINLYIDDNVWPRKKNKPEKQEFYLRLNPHELELVVYLAKKHIAICNKEKERLHREKEEKRRCW